MDNIAYVDSPSLLERLEFCLCLIQSNMLSLVENPSEGAALRDVLAVLNSAVRQNSMDNTALAELYTENFSLDRLSEVTWAQQLGSNPEMDRHDDMNSVGVNESWLVLQRGLAASHDHDKDRRRSQESSGLIQPEHSFSRDSFSFKLCVSLMLRLSSGWSYRDIQKFVANVKSRVMSSDRSPLLLLRFL